MSTERIYQNDAYAVSNEAVVTAIRIENGCDVIACDASVFFPEGGGQPSDAGTVVFACDAAPRAGNDILTACDAAPRAGSDDPTAGGGRPSSSESRGSAAGGSSPSYESRGSAAGAVFEIVRAYDESLEDDVWHVTDAPAGTFRTGDRVTLTIDWDLRFRNMQRHCGEHMLSGTMYSLFGGVNRGFHMGEDYITIDIDLDGRMLDAEELDLAQATVNEAIWAGLPVTVTWFDDYESSLAMPVRKQVPHDGRVSVVTVGDAGDPYDCIACCGTHPSNSAEVGLLAIYKCEPNKGMNRIFFDCGKAAFDRLTADSALLAEAARRYSCSPSDLASRLDLEAQNISGLKARLAALTAYVKDAEKARILGDIKGCANSDTQTDTQTDTQADSRQLSIATGSDTCEADRPATLTYKYASDTLMTDDLLKLGFSVINETEGLLLLMMDTAKHTCLLFSSGSAKCGDLVKEFAPKYNGRGGGRPDNARAVFPDKASMNAFADAVIESVSTHM